MSLGIHLVVFTSLFSFFLSLCPRSLVTPFGFEFRIVVTFHVRWAIGVSVTDMGFCYSFDTTTLVLTVLRHCSDQV